MTVELLQTLSIVAYILAGVLLLLSVALFFLLDVPKLYGDISGRTAKKAIEAIRQQNESSGNRANKPSVVNATRGRLTDKITQSGNLVPVTDGLPLSVGTEKFATDLLATQAAEAMGISGNSNETTVLSGELMQTNETTVLSGELLQAGETTVLTGSLPPMEETTVLVSQTHLNTESSQFSGFSVDVEMHFAESTEIIE